MSCIVNNKPCTKCCESIHIKSKAIKDIFDGKKTPIGYEARFIAKHWIPISSDDAMYENPFPFSHDGFVDYADEEYTMFFKCTLVDKSSGCTNYNGRPNVCSGYPGYGESPDMNTFPNGEYVYGCSEFLGAKNV